MGDPVSQRNRSDPRSQASRWRTESDRTLHPSDRQASHRRRPDCQLPVPDIDQTRPKRDIYGIPEGHPMYQPDLRAVPRKPEEPVGGWKAALTPAPDPKCTKKKKGNGKGKDKGKKKSKSKSKPTAPAARSQSPLPRLYRPWLGDTRSDPHYSSQPPPGDGDRRYPLPATRTETGEDPWEWFFGDKGYYTVHPGEEKPWWWEERG